MIKNIHDQKNIKSNKQLLTATDSITVNVMDRIMSTSNILLDQNFNANGVDIMEFDPSVLFPPPQFGGGYMTVPYVYQNDELN